MYQSFDARIVRLTRVTTTEYAITSNFSHEICQLLKIRVKQSRVKVLAGLQALYPCGGGCSCLVAREGRLGALILMDESWGVAQQIHVPTKRFALRALLVGFKPTFSPMQAVTLTTWRKRHPGDKRQP
jgi:hypothetical protein